MTVPIISFINNKGGVGKTSLAYHLAWTIANQGKSILVADLDPQANLTAAFLNEERIEFIWDDSGPRRTIFGALSPLIRNVGDISDEPHSEFIDEHLQLIPGDLFLTQFEDKLSHNWPLCLQGDEAAFRITTAFWRIIQRVADRKRADVVLVDLGPNLGAINRAAMIATDFVAVPLAADLFSLQGLKNLGPTLREWRSEWDDRKVQAGKKHVDFVLPPGNMQPIGYIVMQHAVRQNRPVKAYERWIGQIPDVYRQHVVGDGSNWTSVSADPMRIGEVKHYRSLMPMAQEARKPIFRLTSADGAVGSHAGLVAEARRNFQGLARELMQRCGFPEPASMKTDIR